MLVGNRDGEVDVESARDERGEVSDRPDQRRQVESWLQDTSITVFYDTKSSAVSILPRQRKRSFPYD